MSLGLAPAVHAPACIRTPNALRLHPPGPPCPRQTHLPRLHRQEYGDYFGICVSGYPETHPDLIVDDPVAMEANYRSDLAYLKAKVEAGADFIITQLFYDVDCFLAFVRDCRDEGIAVPILPGLMPLMTYGGFKRMTAFCKTRVPAHIAATVEALKDNDEAIKVGGRVGGAAVRNVEACLSEGL